MLRFSGSSQNPGSSVLDELQLSNAAVTSGSNFAIFSRKMVQAQLLKFFIKKTTEGIIFP